MAGSSSYASSVIHVPGDFSTIQAAVTAAGPGSTVIVRPGTYNEKVTIPSGKDGLTVRRSGHRRIVVDAAAVGGPVFDINSNNVTLRGLSLRNGDDNGATCTANGCTFVGDRVEGDTRDCIHVVGDFAAVSGSRLRGCQNDGVDITGNGARLRGNRFHGIGNTCDQITGNFASVSKEKMRGCGFTGVGIAGDGALVSRVRTIDALTGISVLGNAAKVRENLTVHGDGGEGIAIFGENPIVDHNLTTQSFSAGILVFCDDDPLGGAPAASACDSGLVQRNTAIHTSPGGGHHGECCSRHGRFTIRNNRIDQANFAGIAATMSGGVVQGNTVTRSGFGPTILGPAAAFKITGDGNAIRDNKAVRNTRDGFNISGSANLIRNNAASRNNLDGLQVFGGSGNVIVHNVVVKNVGDGIENGTAASPATLTIVRDNVSKGNGEVDCANDGGSTLSASRNVCGDRQNFAGPGLAE